METPARVLSYVALGLATLTLAACGTEQISASETLINDGQPRPNDGALEVSIGPSPETFAEEASLYLPVPGVVTKIPPRYEVYMDGKRLVHETGEPALFAEGHGGVVGYLDASPHHFELRGIDHATTFTIEADITTGLITHLYEFQSTNGWEGEAVSYPFAPSDGTQHVSVLNALREGGSIQVVTCADPATCTPVSPALAVGESFEGDFPAAYGDDGRSSLSLSGAGIGYQLVPSASLPNPQVNPARITTLLPDQDPNNPVFNLTAAPVYLGDDGALQLTLP